MEKLLLESREQSLLDKEFCKRLARSFSNYSGRAGKPAVKWTEVQCWFHDRQRSHPLKDASSPNPPKKSSLPEAIPLKEAHEGRQAKALWKVSLISAFFDDVILKTEEVPDLSELEFEARSSDGAWYDVDTFLTHRDLSSGEAEVLVRFVGFDAEGDEWVKVKTDIRERSIPLEDSECGKVKVGDLIICFQEMGDEARYYDAHVIEIQKRMHDIRGCRCLFSIQYDHDNTKARKGSFGEIMLPADILDFSQMLNFLQSRVERFETAIRERILWHSEKFLVGVSDPPCLQQLGLRSKNEESAPSK
ncbi:hypothetical protein RHSIM_RhsimUnG0235600 [Rhododendron simsii]|uniref:SAWADEE domain-containing protein n=1 Tax=Rhododendron simsii TaxID=118357 RepID=A0A834FT52_RHOSS|nr:hypothetical protein RHSIM_RhsimUnG0235600 [Rhododendron simsii]